MPPELNELLQSVAEQPTRTPDFDGLARRGLARRRRRHVAAGLSVVVVLGLVTAGVALRPSQPDVVFDSGPRAGLGTWENVPPAPIGPRVAPQVTGDDNLLVIMGGAAPNGTLQFDGAVYDIAARTWRAIAAPPLPETIAIAFTLGDGLLLAVEHEGLQTAVYDFAASRWIELGRPPSVSGGATVMWAGDRVFAWGGTGSSPTGATWDPSAGVWQATSPAPMASRAQAAAVWTGDRLLLWGGHGWMGEEVFDDGATYEPATDTWERLPDAPLQARTQAVAHWTGEAVLVAGGYGPVEPLDAETSQQCGATTCSGSSTPTQLQQAFTDGARYDMAARHWEPIRGPRAVDVTPTSPTRPLLARSPDGSYRVYDDGLRRWRRVPAAPDQAVSLRGVGDDVVALNTPDPGAAPAGARLGGYLLDRDAQQWHALAEADSPRRDDAVVVTAGRRILVWGGRSSAGDHTDGALLTLGQQ